MFGLINKLFSLNPYSSHRHRCARCRLSIEQLEDRAMLSGVTFAPPVDYPVENGVHLVVTGDLDGDSDLDLAVSTNAPGAISVLKNNGDGTFAPAVKFDSGSIVNTLSGADLDGDSDLDLIVTNVATDVISVLLNDGNGSFAPPVSFASGGSDPGLLAAEDLDGDGDVDLAVPNIASHTVTVLLNDGDASFALPVSYGVGVNPAEVTAGDLDGDGDLDLAVANVAPGQPVSVLLNNGDGSFAPAVNYAAGGGQGFVTSADLDGDGDLDLAVGNRQFLGASVLLNNGDGTFAAPVSYGIGTEPSILTTADLDGDSDSDLVVSHRFGNDISLLLNNGDGSFAPAQTLAVGINEPFSIATGDLDGDGDPDLAVTGNDNRVAVLLNTTNRPPSIISAAAVTVPENETFVIDVQSTDPEGDTEGGGLTYSLTGGADAALFSIDINTGELAFNIAPDFENPADANADNVYEVQVTVTDSGLLTAFQNLVVSVTDVDPVGGTSAVIDNVKVLKETGVLTNGQANPILNHLDQAIKNYNKGKTAKAIQKLEQSRNEIQDLIDDGDLAPALGQPLIDTINDLIDEILAG